MNVTIDVGAVLTALALLIPVLVTAYIQIRMLKKQNAKSEEHAAENTAGREQVKKEIIDAVLVNKTTQP